MLDQKSPHSRARLSLTLRIPPWLGGSLSLTHTHRGTPPTRGCFCSHESQEFEFAGHSQPGLPFLNVQHHSELLLRLLPFLLHHSPSGTFTSEGPFDHSHPSFPSIACLGTLRLLISRIRRTSDLEILHTLVPLCPRWNFESLPQLLPFLPAKYTAICASQVVSLY